ncbi:DUF2058 family protein [Myxococcaceae bacterium JPH2]|nr:DUF2058 family protein [Myxococcaceae bacterium JPH2]
MQNLRDKLLKAGLVSEEQAKKSDAPSQTSRRPAPSSESHGAPSGRPPARRDRDENRTAGGPPRREGGGGPPRRDGGRPPYHGGSGGRPAAATTASEKPIPKLPPMPGSKAYQRAESKKQVELDRALRELVLGNQVPLEAGETAFYFMTRKGKLRRLELSPAQAKQLEDGELGVVERPEPAQIEHSLVPASSATQMYALSKKSVRFLNRKEDPVGFMNDEELKARQDAEAAGTAPEIPDEPESTDESSESPASDEDTSGGSTP